jgi:hypothetical protein
VGVAVLDDDHGTQAVLDAGEVGGECACVEFGGEVAGGFESDDEVSAGVSAVSEERGEMAYWQLGKPVLRVINGHDQ